MNTQSNLFGNWCSPRDVAAFLDANHYLGASRRGIAWRDEFGVLVLSAPTSRRLPADGSWLELVRWCLTPGNPNGGSRQWSAVRSSIAAKWPEVTTVVSYSDPAAGHTGALYRACGWGWAPTWHRLRPPPSGNGKWSDGIESVKDRWVDALRPDALRAGMLAVKDASILARMPWAQWVEPRTSRGAAVRGTAGGNFARWKGAAIA